MWVCYYAFPIGSNAFFKDMASKKIYVYITDDSHSPLANSLSYCHYNIVNEQQFSARLEWIDIMIQVGFSLAVIDLI